MPKNEKRRVLKEALKIVDGLGDLIENSYFFQDGDSYFIDITTVFAKGGNGVPDGSSSAVRVPAPGSSAW